jgi:hypothetical protein
VSLADLNADIPDVGAPYRRQSARVRDPSPPITLIYLVQYVQVPDSLDGTAISILMYGLRALQQPQQRSMAINRLSLYSPSDSEPGLNASSLRPLASYREKDPKGRELRRSSRCPRCPWRAQLFKAACAVLGFRDYWRTTASSLQRSGRRLFCQY